MVLGHPWLSRPNLTLIWNRTLFTHGVIFCHVSCLLSTCSSVSCSVLQEEPLDLLNVPEEYLDLNKVFSKS